MIPKGEQEWAPDSEEGQPLFISQDVLLRCRKMGLSWIWTCFPACNGCELCLNWMWSCIDSYFPCQRICSYPIFNEKSCSVVCICWRTTICGGGFRCSCAVLLKALHKQFTFGVKKALQHFNEKLTLTARDKFLFLSPSLRKVQGAKDLWFLSYIDSGPYSPLSRTPVEHGPLKQTNVHILLC